MKTALCLCLIFWASLGAAQGETGAAARAAVERLDQARVLLSEASRRADRVAALTETVKAFEDGLVALREGLRRVAVRRQAIEVELAARSDEISQLLGVLQSIGQAQGPLLLLHPSGPVGAARSGMMIADVTPALQAEVTKLQSDLQEVRDLQLLQDSAVATLEQGLMGAQEARLALTAAISERTDLPRRFADDPARTAQLLAASETLDGFANGLAQIVDEPLSGISPNATALKGTLPLPVQGRILRRFGEPDAAGIVRPGWVVAVRAGALVETPVAATVRFAGPLLDYGNVLILEPAADVLFVIAGLDTVFGETGQILPAGSPVGLIGPDQGGVDAILTEGVGTDTGSRTRTLYLEVREGQSAVDPVTWFVDAG